MDFPKNSALLIVDMINDFARPDGALYVPDTEMMVENIAVLIEQARSKELPVIYVNDAHDPDDKEFDNWGPHAVEGTEGSEVIRELAPEAGEFVIPKKTFSSFFETELDRVLREKSIEYIVLTGTVTNICVYVTAMEAVLRGYKVTVPRNAVAGLDPRDHEFALSQMEKVMGVNVI